MNRRSFFKRTMAFVAGVCAAAVPTKKVYGCNPLLSSIKRRKTIDFNAKEGVRRSGTRLATEKDFQDALTKVVKEKIDDGLKEAFCYGGKLFRVYDLGCYKVLQLRYNKWINRVQIDSRQFLDYKYRNMVCEAMLKSLERTLKIA